MQQTHAIIDKNTSAIVGYAHDGAGVTAQQFLVPLPEGFDLVTAPEWAYDGQALTHDLAAHLARAKAARKVRIKQEAARLIVALDWRLTRAQERTQSGLVATHESVNDVLALREAIRQSSNTAESAVDALTDAAAVQAYVWSVAPV